MQNSKGFYLERKATKNKHSTLTGNFENGGLKDIDIEIKLKASKLSWIKRLLDSNFHPWKTLAAKLLEPVGGNKIFHSNLSVSNECHKVFTSLPTFYNQLTEFWELTSIGICDEPSFALNQSVWNNKHITKNGSPLYDTKSSDKGINYIKDIFNTITYDFKLWNEVKSEFRLPESVIFRWYSIILSIPQDWETIMKKVDSEYSLCSSVNETVSHLFGQCLLTIKLWKIVQKWSTTVGLVLPDLNAKDLVLGFLSTKGSLILENHVLLIFKMFLYRNKQNSNPVSFYYL